MAQTAARLKEAAKLGFGRAVLPESARGEVSGDSGLNLNPIGGLTTLVAEIAARVFHYGWVRPPRIMARKQIHLEGMVDGPSAVADADEDEVASRIYAGLGHLRSFHQSHPAVMRDRIARCTWSFDPRIDEQPPD